LNGSIERCLKEVGLEFRETGNLEKKVLWDNLILRISSSRKKRACRQVLGII